MPRFQYEAMDSEGRTVRKEIVARDSDDAVAKIREQNLFPTRVKEVSDRGAARRGARRTGVRRARRKRGAIVIGGVRSKDLTTFTRQLSTLTDAGIPVVQSLKPARRAACSTWCFSAWRSSARKPSA